MTTGPKDHRAIDAIWKKLDRPLWVVTAATGQKRGGLIATWITQSSLNPQTPTVTAGIAPNHFTCELIDQSGYFGLHLLRPEQLELVARFAATSGRDCDKLGGLKLQQNEKTPILTDCLAWMECQVQARLDAGDRIYFWAEVLAGQVEEQFDSEADSAGPLRESHLGQLAPEVLAELGADRERDIHLQAPWAEGWRKQLPAELAPKTTRSQLD